VVALLVLVAVCYAQTYGNFQKDGGLKGAWYDEVEITSTQDVTAPTVTYTGASTDFFEYYFTEDGTATGAAYNLTDWESGSSDYTYVYFSVAGEDSRFYLLGSVALSFWTGGTVDAPTHTIDAEYCNIDSDNSVTCYVLLWSRVATGTWMPSITAMDQFGNHATYSNTAFADAARPTTFMTIDNKQDMTKPTLTAATGAVTPTAITLGTSTSYSTSQIVTLTVTANDHAEDVTGADPNASGLAGVWAVVTDPDLNEWTFALINQDGSVDDEETTTGSSTWMVVLNFPGYASVGTWTVNKFTAVDHAGNWALDTDAPVETDVTVSWSSSNNDEVTSCQTLTLSDTTPSFDASTTYAFYSVDLSCTEKYTGTNYAYVSYQSPMYVAKGDTTKSSQVIIDSTIFTGMLQMVTPYYTTYSFDNPGLTLFGGAATFSFNIYPGNAGSTVGAWTLYEVITVTDSGAAQRYTADLGAASSVVPSVFAVAIAALFALLRL